ncbi:hypothetical protein [Mycoavidus sp. B2-EB]|uniref:hypothetical protein n=1 Tax=Mycoavidus sp. B2-EB TaxID=2651972 RepID=UPI001628C382|nr:hypothetical protein [Mycoavidus sp. B2-EB]BBO59475.1 hypothetical protein MPB2EB_0594 [Mycoavidus sp. B2-EB]
MFTKPIRLHSFPPSAKEAHAFQNRRGSQSSLSSSVFERLKNLGGLINKKEDEDEASPERMAFADRLFKQGERVQFELLCRIGAEHDDPHLIEKGLEALRNIDGNEVSENPERFESSSHPIREKSGLDFTKTWLKVLRTRDNNEISPAEKSRAEHIVKMVNQAQQANLIKMIIESDDIDFIKQIFRQSESNEEIRELFFNHDYFLLCAATRQATMSDEMYEALSGFRQQMDKTRAQDNKVSLHLATNL